MEMMLCPICRLLYPTEWGMFSHHTLEHWNDLTEDDVIDVEHILGETERKNTTEMRK